MRSWTENFGKFYTNSNEWDAKKKICINCNNNVTAEEMVVMAIRLAKKYNCRIIEGVEFHPEMNGGTFSFIVECHSLTYRYFYDGGKLAHSNDKEVTEKDLTKYQEQFGTRKCIDRNFKKKYWYADNWTGKVQEFKTLKAAKEAASQEIGNTVWIYTNLPYGRPSEIVCKTEASGTTPP